MQRAKRGRRGQRPSNTKPAQYKQAIGGGKRSSCQPPRRSGAKSPRGSPNNLDRLCPLLQRGVRHGAGEACEGVVRANAAGDREAEEPLKLNRVEPRDA